MSNKHYYISNPNSEKGFDEITETEFFAIIGDKEHAPYASEVYRGELTIDDVPEKNRETVASIVANRIARFGEYNKQEVSSEELQTLIEEVL